MDKNRHQIANERRSGVDRRLEAIGYDFPFIDSHGLLVTEDRRKSNRRDTVPGYSADCARLGKQTA